MKYGCFYQCHITAVALLSQVTYDTTPDRESIYNACGTEVDALKADCVKIAISFDK